MNFAEKIKHRRLELGLTLEEVATAVGVKKSTILRWESGEIDNPRRDRIALLAAVLQLPPVSLIEETTGLPEDYEINMEAIRQIKEGVPTSINVTRSENELINLYRSLNTVGQDALMTAARAFSTNAAMAKDPAASVS